MLGLGSRFGWAWDVVSPEVAGRTPERQIVPVAAKEKEPRVNCMIGEKIWQDRWGR